MASLRLSHAHNSGRGHIPLQPPTRPQLSCQLLLPPSTMAHALCCAVMQGFPPAAAAYSAWLGTCSTGSTAATGKKEGTSRQHVSHKQHRATGSQGQQHCKRGEKSWHSGKCWARTQLEPPSRHAIASAQTHPHAAASTPPSHTTSATTTMAEEVERLLEEGVEAVLLMHAAKHAPDDSLQTQDPNYFRAYLEYTFKYMRNAEVATDR